MYPKHLYAKLAKSILSESDSAIAVVSVISLDKWKRKGSFRQFYNHSITDSILNVNNTAVILTLYSHSSYKRLCDSCNALQGNNGTTGKPGIPGRAGLKVSTILLPQG